MTKIKKEGKASQLPSSPPSEGFLPAALVQPNLTWPSQTWLKFHVIRNRNEIWYEWGNLNPFLQFSTSDSILEACSSKNYTLLLRLCYRFPHCFSRRSAYMLLIWFPLRRTLQHWTQDIFHKTHKNEAALKCHLCSNHSNFRVLTTNTYNWTYSY